MTAAKQSLSDLTPDDLLWKFSDKDYGPFSNSMLNYNE